MSPDADPARARPETFRSHLWPRSPRGRLALIGFLIIFAFTQPPLVFVLANKIEPWILGLPFLYAYLLVLYILLILILFWARRNSL